MGKFQLNKKGEDPLKIYKDTFKIANDTVETHLDKLGKMPNPISREAKASVTAEDIVNKLNSNLSNDYYPRETSHVREIENLGDGEVRFGYSGGVIDDEIERMFKASGFRISNIRNIMDAGHLDAEGKLGESKASEMDYFPSGNFWDIDSSYGVKTKDELVKERMFIQHFIDSARNDGFNDGRIETYQLKQDDVERQIASYGGQQLGQRDQDGDLFPYFDVDGTPDKTWDLWGKSQSRNRSDHNESRASERLSQCPSCKGVGCIVCDQSGFVSREDYDKIKKIFESKASEDVTFAGRGDIVTYEDLWDMLDFGSRLSIAYGHIMNQTSDNDFAMFIINSEPEQLSDNHRDWIKSAIDGKGGIDQVKQSMGIESKASEWESVEAIASEDDKPSWATSTTTDDNGNTAWGGRRRDLELWPTDEDEARARAKWNPDNKCGMCGTAFDSVEELKKHANSLGPHYPSDFP